MTAYNNHWHCTCSSRQAQSQLGATLRKLKGPTHLLDPLLGNGLDADELMRK
jgi:hypothetical protein